MACEELEPPPRVVNKFEKIWRDWLYFFWEFVTTLCERVTDLEENPGGGVIVQDEGTPLTTVATTLNFTGGGVEATGAGATKEIAVTNNYLNKDTTDNLTVGYTTDIEAVTIASGTLTPVITFEHFKTLAVSGSFTLAVPSPAGGKGGHCAYRVTVTGVGPWTITKGANVESVGALSPLVFGTKYVLNIYKFSDTDAIVQLNSTA